MVPFTFRFCNYSCQFNIPPWSLQYKVSQVLKNYLKIWCSSTFTTIVFDQVLQLVVFHELYTRWQRKFRYVFWKAEDFRWTHKTDIGGSRQHLAGSLFSCAFYSECIRSVSSISFKSNDIYSFSVLDVTITELVRSGWCADGSFIISWVSWSSVTPVPDLHLFQIAAWKAWK